MHFAASGVEALNRLAEEIRPSLLAVLSDINMPGMDGLELLAEIKKRFPDLPVMMVTAYGDDDRRRRAREIGALDFIPKPVDFDQLKEQLRQLPASGLNMPPYRQQGSRQDGRSGSLCLTSSQP
jgi:two-component system, response regulator, stage 0 sporulation protein F